MVERSPMIASVYSLSASLVYRQVVNLGERTKANKADTQAILCRPPSGLFSADDKFSQSVSPPVPQSHLFCICAGETVPTFVRRPNPTVPAHLVAQSPVPSAVTENSRSPTLLSLVTAVSSALSLRRRERFEPPTRPQLPRFGPDLERSALSPEGQRRCPTPGLIP
ncbi:hypothetical protein Bbelb_222460 [Branchiostoma belcheri]|nr:hypothetical protein Bbelb_222460 [Branchiostoma belcheri]